MSASPGATPVNLLSAIPNPFLHNLVGGPWERAEADVPGINADAFRRCREVIDEVRQTGRSTSLLLEGIAGSGKTHLLARLRAHLERNARDVVFISIRLDAAPTRMWRLFRRQLVDDLLRPWAGAETRLHTMLREHSETAQLSLNLRTVLEHYRAGRHLNESVAWLRGESVSESAIQKLGIGDEGDEEDAAEEQAKDTVIRLCRLAAPEPVVFCCDQAESLQTHAGDDRGLFAYAKVASALLEEVGNAVVISSVQIVFVQTLQECLHRAFFDRLSLHRADLQPLTWKLGQDLILSRIDAVPELEALRRRFPHDALWPLHQADLKAIFEPNDACVARKLLFRAKELFEAARGQRVDEPESVEAALQSYWETALKAAAGAPVDDTLLQGLPILFELTNRRPREGTRPSHSDLVLESPRGATAISAANHQNMNSLQARLKKLLGEVQSGRLPKLVILRAAGLPISPGAAKTRERLQQLQKSGALLVRPSDEVLTAIEAVRRLMADAKSGNLVHKGETVPPKTVQEWLRSHIPNVLTRFLSELSGEVNPTAFAKDLCAFVSDRCIVSVDEAASAVAAGAEEIAQYALAHPHEMGFLPGPPRVLFRLVDASVGDPVG